ncbi:two-component system response regulator DcuR [Pluralibacter gergoviae]|uniref:Transcriptional regulatory protein n=2 Tax=Pluralibacter gergoviae TaxID=61647 RepID=A0A089R779_PLUGE|nr:two-component system response regulator DcuR [Pluralibacter gergoviae]AIR02445.1 transcriptional regulator [Pluralibacter gergoviae]AVR03272.1 two-component system response regulator DcuR [Pluralibacter gergoviae]EKV0914457.1 two-component system response regulator DcuR [Pluralibacter gergoviae]EKV9905868.1 two-component system response regulator DcuR [Pluralibacter gergoviae]EKW6617978.1 two-component system response regulator DcuR [Pluralibacter gergoviae]
MINVMIVDDDAMVAELNRMYIARVPGFRCSATASTLAHAKALVEDRATEIDLLLLDVYMQQDSGLDLLPAIRASGRPIDVIMITSAADAATLQTAIHYGVVDYLIKPFQFPRFEEALTGWLHKKKLMDNHDYYQQAEVDLLLHGGAPEVADSKKLPKGLTAQTLRTLCQWIDAHPDSEFSTDELAQAVNISRVSCRKYLIWLAQINILFTSIHYGATGRPVYRYRLVAEQYGLLKQYSQ